MFSRILTETEREILKKFLEKNEKPEGFRNVKHRIKRYNEKLHQDLNLIDQALKKFEESPT